MLPLSSPPEYDDSLITAKRKVTVSNISRFAVDYAVISLVVVALLWRVIFTARSFYWGDIMLYFQPMYAYAAKMLSGGKLPMWNPYVLCGQPFIGNPQIGMFFPAAILLPFGNIWRVLNLETVLVLIGSGIGLYSYLLEITRNRLAALISATVWCGCGPVLGRIQFPPMFYAIALMPVGIWAVHRYVIRPCVNGWLWMVMASVLMILAAHPQVAYLEFSLYLTLPLAAGNLRLSNLRALYVGLLSALLASVVISSVQLLPVIELASQSSRQMLTLWAANRFHLDPPQLLCFLDPRFFGTPRTGNYWGAGNFWEPDPFVGWLPLILLTVSVWRLVAGAIDVPRRYVNRYWLLVSIFCVWAAVGAQGGLYNLLFYTMPGLAKFHDPARFLIPAALAISIITGLQLDDLAKVVSARKLSTPRLATCTTITFLIAFAPLLWYSADLLPTAMTSRLSMPDATVPAVVRQQAGRVYLPLHTLFADQFVGAGYLDYGSTSARFLQGELATLSPNLQMRDHVSAASGYEPVPLDSYANIERPTAFALYNNSANLGSLMALLGVSSIAVPRAYHVEAPSLRPYRRWPDGARGPLRWYRNTDFQGSIWVTGRSRSVSGNLRLSAALGDPTFQPFHTTLLSAVSTAFADRLSMGGPVAPVITDVRSNTTRFSADVYVQRPAIAVVSLMAYPGWYGTVDGSSTALYRADGGLLAARVPAGRHRIIITYRPQVFVVGLYISLETGAMLLAAFIVNNAAQRRARGTVR